MHLNEKEVNMIGEALVHCLKMMYLESNGKYALSEKFNIDIIERALDVLVEKDETCQNAIELFMVKHGQPTTDA